MKKHLSLLLAMILIMTLTACGGNTDTPSSINTTAPLSTDSGDTSAVTDAPTADIGDGTGVYEGELDANGKFTGWGVWIYHNFRYEGYFVDGVPNGEGTLYEAVEGEEESPGQSAVAPLNVVYGQWIDGKGNGIMTVVYVYDEYASTFEVEVKDGFAAADAIIEGVESGPQAGSAHPSWRVYTSTPIGNIPPWSANGLRINDLPAPEGSGTNMPPVTGPSQSQSPSTPAPSTSAPPAAAVDINELTFNADAISLSAKLNGDGTITYTYKDTSLKPAYSCDGEVFFSIEVQGMDAEMSIITDANFTPYGNDFEPLDLAGMVGLVSTGGSIPVTVDDNGLTATWQCRALGGTELKNLEMFSITYTLNVGGEIVFSEWVRFGAGLVLQ